METFEISRTEIVASAGSAASPNLPYGQWSFVAGTDGKPLVKEATTRNDVNRKVKFYVVVPTGNPQGTERRVYPGALATTTAEAVLFEEGKLLKSATFGIFQNPDGSSTVSGDKLQVEAGIQLAQQAYSASQKAKAATAAPKAAVTI